MPLVEFHRKTGSWKGNERIFGDPIVRISIESDSIKSVEEVFDGGSVIWRGFGFAGNEALYITESYDEVLEIRKNAEKEAKAE